MSPRLARVDLGYFVECFFRDFLLVVSPGLDSYPLGSTLLKPMGTERPLGRDGMESSEELHPASLRYPLGSMRLLNDLLVLGLLASGAKCTLLSLPLTSLLVEEGLRLPFLGLGLFDLGRGVFDPDLGVTTSLKVPLWVYEWNLPPAGSGAVSLVAADGGAGISSSSSAGRESNCVTECAASKGSSSSVISRTLPGLWLATTNRPPLKRL